MKIIFHYEASNISEVNIEISSKNEHQTYGNRTLRKYFRKPREIFKRYSRFYHQEWMDKGDRLLCLPPHRNHYVAVVDPFDQLPTVISPAFLDRWSRSFFSGQFFSLCLSIFFFLGNCLVSSLLISTRFLPFFLCTMPDSLSLRLPVRYICIFSALASISRHFITVKRARYALSSSHIMAIRQRAVLPASIAIQIVLKRGWLSPLMTLKSCKVPYLPFGRSICHDWLSTCRLMSM